MNIFVKDTVGYITKYTGRTSCLVITMQENSTVLEFYDMVYKMIHTEGQILFDDFVKRVTFIHSGISLMDRIDTFKFIDAMTIHLIPTMTTIAIEIECDDICVICLEKYKNPIMLNPGCTHILCKTCAYNYLYHNACTFLKRTPTSNPKFQMGIIILSVSCGNKYECPKCRFEIQSSVIRKILQCS